MMMLSADVRILRISSEDTVPLRHAVLWPDKPQSYVLLPEDSAGHHLGAFLDEAEPAVAVISLFVEPLPASALETAAESLRAGTTPRVRAARFRKFACHPAHQGRGIGTALLAAAFDAAKYAITSNLIAKLITISRVPSHALTGPGLRRRS